MDINVQAKTACSYHSYDTGRIVVELTGIDVRDLIDAIGLDVVLNEIKIEEIIEHYPEKKILDNIDKDNVLEHYGIEPEDDS